MNGQTTQNESKKDDRRGKLIGGTILILIGLLTLAGQYIQSEWFGLLILPALGLIFLAWGIISREFGLLIPGGVLSGIGLGAFLITGPLSGLPEERTGGIFLLAFAAGWFLITLLSTITKHGLAWWPLIPGAILGLIGGALIVGGPALRVLELVGQGWPIILIAIGLYMILWRRGMQK